MSTILNSGITNNGPTWHTEESGDVGSGRGIVLENVGNNTKIEIENIGKKMKWKRQNWGMLVERSYNNGNNRITGGGIQTRGRQQETIDCV